MGIGLKDIKVIQRMQSNIISVDYDVSVLGMLRLDDPDNILIDGIESVGKFRNMLLGRLSSAEQHEVQIHIQPYLINDTLDVYQSHLDRGARVVVWHDDDMLIADSSSRLTIVRTDPANPIRLEGFLVIRAPSMNRILAAWVDEKGGISGALITNPDVVERVAGRLDAIVQSNAH